jgi:hypothetical protein
MGREGESSNPLVPRLRPDRRRDRPLRPAGHLIRLNTKDEFELRGGFPKTAEELFRYTPSLWATWRRIFSRTIKWCCCNGLFPSAAAVF